MNDIINGFNASQKPIKTKQEISSFSNMRSDKKIAFAQIVLTGEEM